MVFLEAGTLKSARLALGLSCEARAAPGDVQAQRCVFSCLGVQVFRCSGDLGVQEGSGRGESGEKKEKEKKMKNNEKKEIKEKKTKKNERRTRENTRKTQRTTKETHKKHKRKTKKNKRKTRNNQGKHQGEKAQGANKKHKAPTKKAHQGANKKGTPRGQTEKAHQGAKQRRHTKGPNREGTPRGQTEKAHQGAKQRNTPRAKLLVEPVLCSCTVVTSQPDTVDMTVTFLSSHRRLELKSDPRENNSHPCAQRTWHPYCVVFHACMVAEPVFLELGC